MTLIINILSYPSIKYVDLYNEFGVIGESFRFPLD